MSKRNTIGTVRRISRDKSIVAVAAAGLILLVHLLLFLRLLPNRWRITKLSARTSSEAGRAKGLPRLSVIVPACNEREGIGSAVDSMLRQDYPNLELVLVNDRSTDDTGRIIVRLSDAHPDQVRVVTVKTLPAGWLGKNHAAWLGSRHATGDWFLFTDADILFEPTCFSRAVAYAEDVGADHLTLFPNVQAHGYWLDAFITFFVYAFSASQRPYLAEDPRSDVGIGIGAFNLIRREAYERIGTHIAISLRPDDDIRLGMRVKRLGMRQRALSGVDLMSVEWYPSLGTALRGLEKNLFAACNYNLWLAAGGLIGLWLTTIAPYLWVWRASGSVRRLLLAAIGLHSFNYAYANRREEGGVERYIPALPVTATIFCYAVARATWLTFVQGGIRWRETFYSLEELRSQSGLEGIPSRSIGLFIRRRGADTGSVIRRPR